MTVNNRVYYSGRAEFRSDGYLKQIALIDVGHTAAARLGAVHRLVGGAQQAGQRIGVLRIEREANRRGTGSSVSSPMR